MNTGNENPSTCQYSWRLHGETRMVQCRRPFGHEDNWHLSGIHVAPHPQNSAVTS